MWHGLSVLSGQHCPIGAGAGPSTGAEALRVGSELVLFSVWSLSSIGTFTLEEQWWSKRGQIGYQVQAWASTGVVQHLRAPEHSWPLPPRAPVIAILTLLQIPVLDPSLLLPPNCALSLEAAPFTSEGAVLEQAVLWQVLIVSWDTKSRVRIVGRQPEP